MVFVGGLHRSGTTPLARALAAHPEVSGFEDTGAKEDEGQYLQTVYPTAADRAGVGPGGFALRPEAHMTEDSPLVRPENRERLLAEWGGHWDLGRRVLVEKSPANLMMTRFLDGLFPEARFLVIMRHPAIVALSTRKWAPRTTMSTLLENWFSAHDTLRADAAHLGLTGSRLHVLSYERLVARPAETLAGVGAFLGLATPIPDGSVEDRSSAYRERWHRLAEVRPRRFARLCESYEERANAFGYSLRDLDRLPPPTEVTGTPQ